ncbi:hypothetical protein ACFE04_008734 [Oxalis oulophora]
MRCYSNAQIEIEEEEEEEEEGRPPFDINLAVILAGFAFEAYTSPPENVGRREVDAAHCKTVFLSDSFVRQIYDGQMFVNLKKGSHLPAMDPWGTSDPYVVMQLDGQVAKSNVKWGTKEPKWNEDFTFHIKLPPGATFQVAAWDANLVTPHKRMGNASISLEGLCDGELHELVVELEGMGGGGEIHIELKYKSFEQIDEEQRWWSIPFVTEFLRRKGFESALKSVLGSEAVPARQFVQYAFGQLKSFNSELSTKDQMNDTKSDEETVGKPSNSVLVSDTSQTENDLERSSSSADEKDSNLDNTQSDKLYWKNFSNVITQNVVQKFGFSAPEKLRWDGFDLLNKFGLQSREYAETLYIESGLATPEAQKVNNDNSIAQSIIESSLPDLKKATQQLLKQTESVLGSLVVLTAAVSQSNKDSDKNGTKEEPKLAVLMDNSVLDEKKTEEMKTLFMTAESAMEAWAMLATAMGHPSFIKSEFEKVCFLDNETTDTQVAIWRDSLRRRLVVAFRGTEQARWKDLRTDLMLAPTGLNPERIGGDFKEEVQVHSGFLSAYDSVRIRIISLIKQAIGFTDDFTEPSYKWHVYITGHSLGGALATLLALELSSSKMAKCGAILVTMYNFGSPRVGNRRFAELYNEKVKDSWRVVNHRDIIPTVPRLMGYCHVAQPVYLSARVPRDNLDNMELLEDGYQGDVIGEYTPDVLVTEFMKGEKELVEKILQTEINIFRSIRDGTALMQHMEDFYYISLLEKVRSNYQSVSRSPDNEQGSRDA